MTKKYAVSDSSLPQNKSVKPFLARELVNIARVVARFPQARR